MAPGSISGPGTKILHAVQRGHINKVKKEEEEKQVCRERWFVLSYLLSFKCLCKTENCYLMPIPVIDTWKDYLIYPNKSSSSNNNMIHYFLSIYHLLRMNTVYYLHPPHNKASLPPFCRPGTWVSKMLSHFLRGLGAENATVRIQSSMCLTHGPDSCYTASSRGIWYQPMKKLKFREVLFVIEHVI